MLGIFLGSGDKPNFKFQGGVGSYSAIDNSREDG
jgi:hypothetical protein